jgi:hypothetical protein
MRSIVHVVVTLLLACPAGFYLSRLPVSLFIKPSIEQVATYPKPMPWDAILVSPHSRYRNELTTMLAAWRQPSLRQLKRPKELFDTLESVQINDATWDDWKNVASARASLDGPLYASLFEGEHTLKDDLKLKTAASKERPPQDYELRVAMTPESEPQELCAKLKALTELVSSTCELREGDKVISSPACPADCKTLAQDKARHDAGFDYSYADVLEKLAKGEIDLALCSPYSAYIAKQAIEEPLSKSTSPRDRQKAPILFGQSSKSKDEDGYRVVIIKSNDGLDLTHDLGQIKFVFASPISTSGYLVPLRYLNGIGVDVVHLNRNTHGLRNHHQVIHTVAHSSHFLAGVPSDKLNKYLEESSRFERAGGLIGTIAGAVAFLGIAIWYKWQLKRQRSQPIKARMGAESVC